MTNKKTNKIAKKVYGSPKKSKLAKFTTIAAFMIVSGLAFNLLQAVSFF